MVESLHTTHEQMMNFRNELEFKSQMQFLEIKNSNRDEVFFVGIPSRLDTVG